MFLNRLRLCFLRMRYGHGGGRANITTTSLKLEVAEARTRFRTILPRRTGAPPVRRPQKCILDQVGVRSGMPV
jgi:hypothetical protein